MVSEGNKQQVITKHNKNLGYFISYIQGSTIQFRMLLVTNTEKMFWKGNTDILELLWFPGLFQCTPGAPAAPSTAALRPTLPIKLTQSWTQSKLQRDHQDHWVQEEISSEWIYLHDFQGGETMVSIPSKYSVKKCNSLTHKRGKVMHWAYSG